MHRNLNLHLDIYTTGKCARGRSSLWASAPRPGALRQLTRAGVGQHRGQRQSLKCNVRLQSVDSAYQGEVPDGSTFMKAVMLEAENRRLNKFKKKKKEKKKTNDSEFRSKVQPCSSRAKLSKTFPLSRSFSPKRTTFAPQDLFIMY